MKLTCCILDDEPLAVELMKSYVLKTPFLELKGAFYSAVTAFDFLRDSPVNLLFCDIQMPEFSGMDLAALISKETKIIFTTAFSNYALDGFKVNAIDYLLKPISYADFLSSAKRALDWFSERQLPGNNLSAQQPRKDSIFVKTECKIQQIKFSSILYIEGLRDYLKIVLEGEPRPVLVLMNMKDMELQLPADLFCRVHRSYIVNLQKIDSVEHNRIVIDKRYIPISDSYKDVFYKIINI